MADVQTNGGNRNPKTLNTVWHGAFAFVPRKDGIEVLTPKVGAHSHYAGTWQIGGLHKLADGARYVLGGVRKTPPAAYFDLKYNIYVKSALAPDVGKLVHSSWILPHPKEIFTSERITIQKSNFSGTIPREVQVPREFGAVQVLTFDLDGSVPSVEGLPEWVPEAREIVNLHVFAEEVNLWNAKSVLRHPTDEFQNLIKLTRLGQQADLDFDYTPGEIPLVQPSAHLPEGLRRIELVSLAANGLLNEDDPEVKAKREGVDSGATMGHPCTNIIIGG
jgi:hypothetical protein